MRAVTFHEYGDPQVLRVDDVPEPHAGPGQVRIRVHAASVNPIDWKLRAGYLQEMMPLDLPSVPGRDAAGVVDEVGEGVTGTTVGDAVFGLTVTGATAEHAVLSAWAQTPEAWTAEQAAGAGLAAVTAIGALDLLGVQTGTTLLVEGAAGGVGSAAVQVAHSRGAEVIGTASQGNHDFLRSFGAIPTTYGAGLADRVRALAPEGVDAVLDTAGSGSLADLVTLVDDPQHVVSIADYNAGALGARLADGSGYVPEAALAEAAALGAKGALSPVVEQVFALDQAAEAHTLSQSGHARGKVVITL